MTCSTEKIENNCQYKLSDLKIDFQIGYLAPSNKKERESDNFLHRKKEKKIRVIQYELSDTESDNFNLTEYNFYSFVGVRGAQLKFIVKLYTGS